MGHAFAFQVVQKRHLREDCGMDDDIKMYREINIAVL